MIVHYLPITVFVCLFIYMNINVILVRLTFANKGSLLINLLTSGEILSGDILSYSIIEEFCPGGICPFPIGYATVIGTHILHR